MVAEETLSGSKNAIAMLRVAEAGDAIMISCTGLPVLVILRPTRQCL